MTLVFVCNFNQSEFESVGDAFVMRCCCGAAVRILAPNPPSYALPGYGVHLKL